MPSQQAHAPVLVILGPTASGKTAVAVELARRVDGEVISADSRAFFAGLDIVTDKPMACDRGGIPHHLVDCVPISGTYDAMAFRADVARLLPEIRARDRRPIIAGGGTLYLGAILRGLFEGPERDEALRLTLSERPSSDLYHELIRVDPAAAEKIHPHDRLRLTRALEVVYITGKPMSEWQKEAKPLPENFLVVGLSREKTQHRVTIEARVRSMLDGGLIEEIAQLQSEGLAPDVQAYRTIGVPEAFDVLNGNISRQQFVSIVSARTWQLVRRQMAWFRRDEGVHWIDVTEREATDIAAEVLSIDVAITSGSEARL